MHYKMKPLCDYNSYFNWVTLTSMAKEYKSLVSYCVLCTHAVLTVQFCSLILNQKRVMSRTTQS